jgi:hypothetical protein
MFELIRCKQEEAPNLPRGPEGATSGLWGLVGLAITDGTLLYFTTEGKRGGKRDGLWRSAL